MELWIEEKKNILCILNDVETFEQQSLSKKIFQTYTGLKKVFAVVQFLCRHFVDLRRCERRIKRILSIGCRRRQTAFGKSLRSIAGCRRRQTAFGKSLRSVTGRRRRELPFDVEGSPRTGDGLSGDGFVVEKRVDSTKVPNDESLHENWKRNWLFFYQSDQKFYVMWPSI